MDIIRDPGGVVKLKFRDLMISFCYPQGSRISTSIQFFTHRGDLWKQVEIIGNLCEFSTKKTGPCFWEPK